MIETVLERKDIRNVVRVAIIVVAPSDVTREKLKTNDEEVEKVTFDELNMDSLDKVDVCLELDKRISVDTDYEKVAKMKTVGELVSYIENLINVKV